MTSPPRINSLNAAAPPRAQKETACDDHDGAWAQVLVRGAREPANNEKIIAWTKNFYDAVHPYSAGGAYVNFLMGDEGEERVKKTYGGNYERLAAIKKKYDPDNFFRVNQNIKPS